MKIAIINDTHFGARSDSQLFSDYFFKFFEETFFPYCIENGIDTILHLGDFVDRRKFINFNTLNQIRTRFLDKLDEYDMEVHCILGNHDTFYKNTNDLNSLREMFYNYPRFHVYETPRSIELGGCDFGLVPWINDENKTDSLEFIKNCKSSILCGHFELNGYQVIRGVNEQHGLDIDDILARYEMVLSGHFHCKQSKNNVHYLGTQYQITFGDLNEDKGFHIFDTSQRELQFIPNPSKMFYSYTWNDNDEEYIDKLMNMDCTHLEKSYIKLYVENKSDPVRFEQFLDMLYDHEVSNITIVDVTESLDWETEDVDMGQDTITLIHESIDELEIDNKEDVKRLIRDLYTESLSL